MAIAPFSSLTLPEDLPPALAQACRDFLLASAGDRRQRLRQYGLGRYDFLALLPATDANLRCLSRFLAQPSRVKFPQLQGVELPGAALEGVNWIRGNLQGANLQGARLCRADLLFADFSGADLRRADLRGATLAETVWHQAQVQGCHLGTGLGLSTEQALDLVRRGAMIADSDA